VAVSATTGTSRLILSMSVSLDGFVARRDNVIDWLADRGDGRPSNDDRRHRANLELLGQVGHIVLGRRAYEDMVRAWPGSDSPMAMLMNTLPKTVFSSTLPGVEWSNARVSREAVEDEIPRLRGQPGKDIVCFGGARFAHSLARHRLIDEYRLTIQPVALGDGLSLLHGLPEPQRLNLYSSTAYADGAVTQIYVPA
jgi:dihydrofolate reductase